MLAILQDVGFFVRYGVIALAILGLWVGLRRAGLTPQARLTGIVTTTVLLAWYVTMDQLGRAGFFPPRMAAMLPLCWGIALLWLIPLLRSQILGAALDAIPLWWLIGLQAYRFLGGLNWFALLAAGRLPAEFAMRAGINDCAVGVLAVITALYVHWGGRGWRVAAIAWNILGLFDFASGIESSIMGRVSGAGFTGLFLAYTLPYPPVMIAAFMAPLSVDFHVLSLRQLARAIKRERRPGRPAAMLDLPQHNASG